MPTIRKLPTGPHHFLINQLFPQVRDAALSHHLSDACPCQAKAEYLQTRTKIKTMTPHYKKSRTLLGAGKQCGG